MLTRLFGCEQQPHIWYVKDWPSLYVTVGVPCCSSSPKVYLESCYPRAHERLAAHSCAACPPLKGLLPSTGEKWPKLDKTKKKRSQALPHFLSLIYVSSMQDKHRGPACSLDYHSPVYQLQTLLHLCNQTFLCSVLTAQASMQMPHPV